MGLPPSNGATNATVSWPLPVLMVGLAGASGAVGLGMAAADRGGDVLALAGALAVFAGAGGGVAGDGVAAVERRDERDGELAVAGADGGIGGGVGCGRVGDGGGGPGGRCSCACRRSCRLCWCRWRCSR